MSNKKIDYSFIRSEMHKYKNALYALLLFSMVINILSIVPTIYMLQLFERVMQSRNLSTLLYLSMIALLLTVIWTLIEAVRTQVLQRVAVALDGQVGGAVFHRLHRQSDTLPPAARQMVMQDVNVLREFVAGPLVVQSLDFLFAPLFVFIAFLFHPVLGLTLLGILVLIGGLTLLNQHLLRGDTLRAQQAGQRAQEFGRAVMQAAEPARVMGMLPALNLRWRIRQSEALGWQEKAQLRSGPVGGLLRFMRHAYPLVMLGVGVLLYLEQMVGAGSVFAASLLSGRAIGPVDAVVSNARSFWIVRDAIERLDTVMGDDDAARQQVPLPRPDGALVVSRLSATAPGRDAVILSDISFSLPPGRVLGVVGASGAGKSTLARVLVGAWKPRRGQVSLGGHDLQHYDQDELGQAVGYVPQEAQLLPGTVAENISRFDDQDEHSARRLLAAVRMAGIGELVQSLPDGLNTDLGPEGHGLSGGQRQRIALARAVYGDPHLVVLDEPNANLDAVGEESLARTLAALKERGAVVVIVTHRLNMLAWCDDVLVMNAGAVHAFGRREQVLARLPAYRSPPRVANDVESPGADRIQEATR